MAVFVLLIALLFNLAHATPSPTPFPTPPVSSVVCSSYSSCSSCVGQSACRWCIKGLGFSGGDDVCVKSLGEFNTSETISTNNCQSIVSISAQCDIVDDGEKAWSTWLTVVIVISVLVYLLPCIIACCAMIFVFFFHQSTKKNKAPMNQGRVINAPPPQYQQPQYHQPQYQQQQSYPPPPQPSYNPAYETSKGGHRSRRASGTHRSRSSSQATAPAPVSATATSSYDVPSL